MSFTHSTPFWKRALGVSGYLAFCTVSLGVGTGVGWIQQSPVLTRLLKDRGLHLLHMQPADPFQGRDSFTLLVLGCDEDWYFGGKQLIRHKARSDMMLLARLDFKNNRITGLSIPRDTLCEVDGYKAQKINAYHLLGGNDLAQKAVETLLPGVHIDKTVALNFDSFNQMIDAAGGVDVYVPKNMNYDDFRGHLHIHLKAGRQHLNGEQAQGFVRFRHTDSDFARTSRQRDFLLAFKDQVESHPLTLPTVINKGVDVMDHVLSDDEIAAMAEFAQKIGSDNIQMAQLPVVDANDKFYDLRMDDTNAMPLLRKLHFIDGGGSIGDSIAGQ